jgi:inhibitor of growth protein 3
MAGTEDPAAVLELFIHDVANLPAEIQHYFEEAQAKQEEINECQTIINHRDGQLQKFIKHNGSLVVNPKEEQYGKTIIEKFDRMRSLQDEKVMLVEKASALLDRYVKRLDRKIADLQNDGVMPLDPQMPTLLKDSPGNLVPPASTSGTGANTPLQPLSMNGPASTSLTHAAIDRIARAAAAGRIGSPGVTGLQNHPMLNPSHIGTAPSIAAMNLNRSHREMSVGSEKRRRLNQTIGNFPAQPSHLARQSSLGPGTPKASTPGGSRAGSAGPRPAKKAAAATKKVLPPSQLSRKKTTKAGLPKKSARRIIGMSRASPSTTGDDSAMSEMSDEENMSRSGGGDEDVEMDEDAQDDTKYCYCGEVSYGDMVACDNADCKGQWFHWKCAGITEEPEGEWLCRDCAKLPPSKIKRA